MALKSGNSKIVTLLPLSFHLTKYQNSMETQFRHFFFLKKKGTLTNSTLFHKKTITMSKFKNQLAKFYFPISHYLRDIQKQTRIDTSSTKHPLAYPGSQWRGWQPSGLTFKSQQRQKTLGNLFSSILPQWTKSPHTHCW